MILSMDEDRPNLYEIETLYGILNRICIVKELLPLPVSISLDISAGQKEGNYFGTCYTHGKYLCFNLYYLFM